MEEDKFLDQEALHVLKGLEEEEGDQSRFLGEEGDVASSAGVDQVACANQWWEAITAIVQSWGKGRR